jgi:hypothetical protein
MHNLNNTLFSVLDFFVIIFCHLIIVNTMSSLTPKVLDAVLSKSASKQPLFKEKWMLEFKTCFLEY